MSEKQLWWSVCSATAGKLLLLGYLSLENIQDIKSSSPHTYSVMKLNRLGVMNLCWSRTDIQLWRVARPYESTLYVGTQSAFHSHLLSAYIFDHWELFPAPHTNTKNMKHRFVSGLRLWWILLLVVGSHQHVGIFGCFLSIHSNKISLLVLLCTCLALGNQRSNCLDAISWPCSVSTSLRIMDYISHTNTCHGWKRGVRVHPISKHSQQSGFSNWTRSCCHSLNSDTHMPSHLIVRISVTVLTLGITPPQLRCFC